MHLSETKENQEYVVDSIEIDENTRRRLESIAIIKDAHIKVIFQHLSGTIIQVGDTRLALDKMVTSKIAVKSLNCPCCLEKKEEVKENA